MDSGLYFAAGFATAAALTTYLLRKGRVSVSDTETITTTTVRSTTASGSGGSAVYESQKAVHEYLCFHYGNTDAFPYDFGPKESLEFPKKCAEYCATNASSKNAALDLGCAVGGSTFELARHFSVVLGIDFSHAFIDAANELKELGRMQYKTAEEGTLIAHREAIVPGTIDRSRCSFMQGDACNLPTSLTKFDAILCGNLLCRLPDPLLLLNRLPSLMNPSGVVVLVSPYSWLAEYTPTEKWLGGFKKSNKAVHSKESLKKLMMGNGFMPVRDEDTSFLIREHARKFQWGVSHTTIWRYVGKFN